ncbi:hypothetical protein FJ364_05985 [Candidatus Dependentiae bacterium]|nr:hypothetical protein [Candidatus Dependentiae bacterium]
MENLPDFEIYEFYEPHWWENLWAQIGISVVIVLIITTLVYLIFTRRQKSLTPGQIAFQALSNITSKDFSNKKEVKAVYFAITFIIKQYLSKQFGLAVLDKTDDELIAFIEEKQFHLPTLEALKKIHHNALWVKFANYDMIKTQVELDVTLARHIIETLELLVINQQQIKKA